MTESPIAVLLVEDNPGDARLVQEMLREVAPARFALTHLPRLDAALAHLQAHSPDAILLDLSLPDGHGVQTVARVHAAAPRVPIVVMSGLADERLAIAGVQQGAQDYLVKGRVEGDGLVRALRYAIERQHAKDRLEAHAKALEAKTREQDAFIYTVSHDLRAPLVSLQGMAELLLADYGAGLADGARAYVDRIAANAHKMHTLLDDLLAISRVGRVDEDRAGVDLGAVVDEVCEQLGHALGVRGAVVRPERPLPVVWASRARMIQVFTNLIHNAVTYTPDERTPLVRIAALEHPDCWEIAVRDNGIGIPAQFHDRVLGIFQRLPGGKTLNPAGSGVGLAIVARIVETHGGRLWIASQEGSGTRSTLRYPRETWRMLDNRGMGPFPASGSRASEEDGRR